ncbi:MAG: nicotinamide riboside transporter PnuC [Ostreibacterium sp.]
MKLLKKLTNEWSTGWIITWFTVGVAILSYAFWETTKHSLWDWFYLSVSIIGLLCVASLSFRKNLLGNGLGIVANIGETITQTVHGATGLLLAPIFYLSTHIFGLSYWAKHQDNDGNMLPKLSSPTVWIVTLIFIIIGLILFPLINDQLTKYHFIDKSDPNFYWINIIAFVLGVAAQACMILRYSFSWWLWIIVNFVWLGVNLMTQNYIFACQTMIYQVNAIIGLYEWHQQKQV